MSNRRSGPSGLDVHLSRTVRLQGAIRVPCGAGAVDVREVSESISRPAWRRSGEPMYRPSGEGRYVRADGQPSMRSKVVPLDDDYYEAAFLLRHLLLGPERMLELLDAANPSAADDEATS